MNRLNELRKQIKISRTQLAAASGVSERHIYFIENGERNPSMKTAQLLAKALNCTVDDIFLHNDCTNSTLKHDNA